MADLTPHNLLDQIVATCTQSDIVEAYTVRSLDIDILSLRVLLIDDSFIDVFYNAATAKMAFALIERRARIYGKDNAKIGWRMHPFDNPKSHHLCESISFEAFLAEVRTHRF